MSNTPPPPYSEVDEGLGRSDQARPSSIQVEPRIPPGAIELQPDQVVSFLNSKDGREARIIVVPKSRQASPAPPVPVSAHVNIELLKDSCQTPEGGRYIVNRDGVLEHYSRDRYRRLRARQCICGVAFFVVVIFFSFFLPGRRRRY